MPTPPPVVPTDRDLRIERLRVHPAGFGGIYISQAAVERAREYWAMGFKVPVLDLKETVGNFKGTVENFKGTFESLWARRRATEYVDPDSEPPTEWKEAVRPSGSVVSRLDSTGIEVLEDMGTTEQIEVATEPTGVATVVETHFRIRCECGRRWWALDLNPTTCPRCDRIVAIQSTD